MNAIVRNIRTDNGTMFVNQTLNDYYENVRISHQTSLARTPQQIGVMKRQNRTLVEAARTTSGLAPHLMTLETLSSGLVPNHIPQPPNVPPKKIPVATAPRPIDLIGSPVSTLIDQDAPSTNSTSQGSSSNLQSSYTPLEILGKWPKIHPLANVIRDPSRAVSPRKQLKTDAMWCYFNACLTLVELKNFKDAMLESSWINALQEEIHKFEQ
nr:integrase, catalytic region, zinc finger, CCHC-type, peptidase aspartic, catalytic [Tanacetum cinerariifolium]